MKIIILLLFIPIFSFFVSIQNIKIKPKQLFDKKTFNGWEGDTLNTWQIEDGALVGGSLENIVPLNNFLCTKKSYTNFILKLKIKLIGKEGFLNSGVQFRSKRLINPAHEMTGYQADWGNDYWACLYDESRRNKTLAKADSSQIMKHIKLNDWNNYEIRAVNRNIKLFINGYKSVDYNEKDLSIPQEGLIGLQIHGGGKAKAAFKDIYIQELK